MKSICRFFIRDGESIKICPRECPNCIGKSDEKRAEHPCSSLSYFLSKNSSNLSRSSFQESQKINKPKENGSSRVLCFPLFDHKLVETGGRHLWVARCSITCVNCRGTLPFTKCYLESVSRYPTLSNAWKSVHQIQSLVLPMRSVFQSSQICRSKIMDSFQKIEHLKRFFVRLDETLKCPISLGLMKEPTILADGFTYDWTLIRDWLTRSTYSPMTGAQLTTPNYYLNVSVMTVTRMNEQLIDPWMAAVTTIENPNFGEEFMANETDCLASMVNHCKDLQKHLDDAKKIFDELKRNCGFKDPVVAQDNWMYERSQIEEYFERYNFSPIRISFRMTDKTLFPNHLIRNLAKDLNELQKVLGWN